MEQYKEDFIKFIVKCDALKFGEFKLKSGRIAPYFISSGMFNDGEKINELGKYYARAIKEHFGEKFDGIYGPAYKGISLCVAASIGLAGIGVNKGYVFNRKEAKDYGLKENLIGMQVNESTKLILVDDVITSGKAIRESLEFLKQNGNPKVCGIIISVDRQEKGTGNKSAISQVSEELGIPIYSIVKFSEIVNVLYNKKLGGKIYIDDAMKKKIDEYVKEHGAK